MCCSYGGHRGGYSGRDAYHITLEFLKATMHIRLGISANRGVPRAQTRFWLLT